MRHNRSSSTEPRGERGFSLIEVMISMVILTIGLVGLLGVFGLAISTNQTSQQDMIARQQASEAMESIFTARNTSQLQFSQIANVSTGGIFLDNAQPIKCAGPDGILGTADDTACLTASGATCPNAGVACLTEPGPDGLVGTSDDVILSLANYTRTISIQQLLDGNNNVIPTLMSVTITITYTVPGRSLTKNYVLNEYVSSYH